MGQLIHIGQGSYFTPQLLEMWSAEKRFAEFINYDEVKKWIGFGGIRNEEDYLITPTGHRLLGSNPISKKLEDVEALRK